MQCREADCTNPVAYTFSWPWGNNEAVCSEHAVLATQLATNLAVTITLHPVEITVPSSPEVADCLERVAELETANSQLSADLVAARERILQAAEQFQQLQGTLSQVSTRQAVQEVEIVGLRTTLTASNDARDNYLARIQHARAELGDFAPDSLDLEKQFPAPEVVEGAAP